MKYNKLSSIFIIVVCVGAYGQNPSFSPEQIIDEGDFISYVATSPISGTYGLPTIREIKGGTKIIPIYEDSLRYEARGAFEYACKIWEEALPTTFPIRIRVKLDTLTNNVPANVFSRVNQNLKTGMETDISPSANLAQIKATIYGDRAHLYRRNPSYSMLDSLSFFQPEMTITFYNYDKRLYNNCSFSKDGISDNTKYDFVTLVLRDIARGLGICCNFRKYQNYLRYQHANITPFEKRIKDNLPSDSCQALTYATQGSIEIGTGIDSDYTLYAPSTWENQVSLNYFIPSSNKKITRLLSCDFGKGTVIRDISDDNLTYFIKKYLYWNSNDNGITTGGYDKHTEIQVSTSDSIPFHGSITLSSNDFTQAISYSNTASDSYTEKQLSNRNVVEEDPVLEGYMKQFMPRYISTTNHMMQEGFSISFLLKNGTWDCVYNTIMLIDDEIDYSDLDFHYDKDQYAYTIDGKLRLRITRCKFDYFYGNHYKTQSKYYVMNEVPQKAKMKMSHVIPDYYDEYIRDIKIGVKNLEGTTRIVVSQWFEGDDYPFNYEVSDFEKGYFIASVDKEFESTFRITSYNAYGYTQSDTIVIPPLEPATDLSLNFTYKNGYIQFTPQSSRMVGKKFIKNYDIFRLCSLEGKSFSEKNMNTMAVLEDNRIDVSSLPTGLYTITVYDTRGGKYRFKFRK